jgi:hypothetical protein
LAIHSSLAPCLTVRFCGFFHSAYRLFFNPLARSLPGRGGASARGRPRPRPGSVRAVARAVFHTPRRTSSRASVAHFTTWNGSAHWTAAGHRAATTSAIQSAASADTCVMAAHRSGPSSSKNMFRVALSRPGAAQINRRES